MDDKKRHIYRDQRAVVVGTVSRQLLGPNPRRIGVIVSAPADIGESNTAWTRAALNNARFAADPVPGIDFTVPAGGYATLDLTTRNVTSGGGSPGTLVYTPAGGADLQILTVGGTYIEPFGMHLSAGDRIRWIEGGAGADENVYYYMGGKLFSSGGRLTLDFSRSAVLDSGITLYPGTLPLYLAQEHIGQSFTEGISAVASTTMTVGVLDLFEDCSCPSMVMGGTK